MIQDPGPVEGHVTLPRRWPLAAALGMTAALIGQVYWLGSYTTGVDSRLVGLVESDQRLIARSDERYAVLIGRLDSLERDRDRLPALEARFGRIEEKMGMMLELLRETRQERHPKR